MRSPARGTALGLSTVAAITAHASAAMAQVDAAQATPSTGVYGPAVVVLVIGAAAVGYWMGRGQTRPLRRVISAPAPSANSTSAFGEFASAIDPGTSAQATSEEAAPEPAPAATSAAHTDDDTSAAAPAPSQPATAPDPENPHQVLERLRHADRLASVGKMASSMAHEMGTPLMVISGNAQLILMDPEDAAEVTTLSQVIVEQTARLQEIIESMLSYTRRRGPAAALQTHRVADVVQSAATLLQFEADDRDVKIETTGPAELEAALDRGKMLQLITNIGANAVYASQAGGSVQLEWSNTQRDGADWLLVRITDGGAGMSEEQLARITEPFYTTKPEGQGTGLGMAICAQILEELGGELGVVSALGEGTVMSINVPFAHSDDEETPV